MDLALAGTGTTYRLLPRSVLGVLWLQTHFETSTWPLLCSGSVRLTASSTDQLCRDAEAAGLRVSRIPALAAA
jgi:hypothetical protein